METMVERIVIMPTRYGDGAKISSLSRPFGVLSKDGYAGPRSKRRWSKSHHARCCAVTGIFTAVDTPKLPRHAATLSTCWLVPCLSEIKSGHIDGVGRRELASLRCARQHGWFA